jgi:hypothetical protein
MEGWLSIDGGDFVILQGKGSDDFLDSGVDGERRHFHACDGCSARAVGSL